MKTGRQVCFDLEFLSTKISFIRGVENPCKNLYVSVARVLIFSRVYCGRLIFLKQLWKDDDLLLYVILIAHSCIRFILLLRLRLVS